MTGGYLLSIFDGEAERSTPPRAQLHSLLALASCLLLAGCPDPIPGPTPCADDLRSEPAIDSTVPEDGLAEARSACKFGKGDTTATTLGTEQRVVTAPSDIPIDHVIVIVLENRSFDHYMTELGGDVDVGTLAETNATALGLPLGRMPETSFKAAVSDLNHEWEGTHLQYDGGALDGFVVATPPDGGGTMNYYAKKDVLLYHSLAGAFATSDRYFSSLLGPTWPNRYFMFAATAAGRTTTPSENLRQLELPEFGLPTLFSALGERARVYSPNPLPLTTLMLGSTSLTVRTLKDLKSDAANGTLPAFSFVEPIMTGTRRCDDHPPYDIRRAQAFISCLVSAIGTSPSWARTALFITWDEHGGYYDHVPPPRACEPDGLRPASHAFDRLGFRVPLLIASPYARRGYVSHVVADHTSIVRFVEHLFGLGAMTKRDANAWPLLDAFDFSSPTTPQFPTDVIPDVGLDPADYCE